MFGTRWQPMAEMNRLRDEMERAFGRYGNAHHPYRSGPSFPPMNLWEDDDNLYVEAELPGLELDDLEIYVSGGNQLSISGERRLPELKEGAWHRQERGFGKFRRTFQLPVDVDSDGVSATFHNGVLEITLAKSEEVKPKRIEVKAN